MPNQKNVIVNLRRSRMFSELNRLLAAAHWAQQNNRRLIPRWVGGRYAPPSTDGFGRYFHRLDHDPTAADSAAETVDRQDARFGPRHRIVAPRGPLPPAVQKKYGEPTSLLPPLDRALGQRLIATALVPRWEILAMVAAAWSANRLDARGPVIGLHLRGPGRLHGGAGWFCERLGEGNPPFAAYWRAVDRLPADQPILLCTDAGCVRRGVVERYGADRVACVSGQLPEEGEPHKGDRYPPEALGLSILVDAWLLAHCSFFVHGNSNVANFVLCLNPALPHEDIYADLYPK